MAFDRDVKAKNYGEFTVLQYKIKVLAFKITVSICTSSDLNFITQKTMEKAG